MLAAVLGSRQASAAPCVPARVTSDTGALPEPWRRALTALVESTAREGLPWSCSEALLALTVGEPDRPARLTVTMPGWPELEREVPLLEDLVPIGEALMAKPIARLAHPPAPVEAPAARAPAPEPSLPRPTTEPRLLVDALTSVRYSGHVNAVWAGFGFRVAIPIERFSVAIWARYDVAVTTLQRTPSDFSMSSGSVGLAAGYRLLAKPIELTVALEPSIAVITMDGGPDASGVGVNGARGDFRLGARFQAALPFSPRWRGLLAVDGELAPMAMASAKHRTIDAQLPSIPSFTLGVSLGGELVLR